MSDQTEALRLADALRSDGLDPGSTVRIDAAAELCRLHAPNSELRNALRKIVHAAKVHDFHNKLSVDGRLFYNIAADILANVEEEQ